jgi:hypothetical protein
MYWYIILKSKVILSSILFIFQSSPCLYWSVFNLDSGLVLIELELIVHVRAAVNIRSPIPVPTGADNMIVI